MAGWQVAGTIRDGTFFSAVVPNTHDAGRWLDLALSLPLGRHALLARDIDAVAFGPALFGAPEALGGVACGYRFHHDDDHAADVAAVFGRIAAARVRLGLSPVKRMGGVAPLLARELALVNKGTVGPYDALRASLQVAAARSGSRALKGYLVEATSVDVVDLPPKFLSQPNLELEIAVTHYKPPGAAWAQLVILVIYDAAATFEILNFSARTRQQLASESREHLGGGGGDLRLHQFVGAGGTDVDEGDGQSELLRASHEPETRVDRQGRADHQQDLARGEQLPGGGQRRRRDVAAEEDDIGLERASAGLARDHPKGRHQVGGEIGVAVGQGFGAELQPAGVRLQKALLQLVSRLGDPTAHAADLRQRAVQLDHPAASRAVVQAIDVLGDHPGEEARCFERRQRAMGGVGLRRAKARPPEGRARPVAAAHVFAPQEGLLLDWVSRPGPPVAPIVGDSRLGAAAGAGQRDDAPPGQQGEQRRDEVESEPLAVAFVEVCVDVFADDLASGRGGDGRPRCARGGD